MKFVKIFLILFSFVLIKPSFNSKCKDHFEEYWPTYVAIFLGGRILRIPVTYFANKNLLRIYPNVYKNINDVLYNKPWMKREISEKLDAILQEMRFRRP